MVKIPEGSQKDIDGSWLTPSGDHIIELDFTDEELNLLNETAALRGFNPEDEESFNDFIIEVLKEHMDYLKEKENLKNEP